MLSIRVNLGTLAREFLRVPPDAKVKSMNESEINFYPFHLFPRATSSLIVVLSLCVQARQVGITLYSIGIGPEIDQEELVKIAGEVARVYHVETYDDINQLKRKIGLELDRCRPLAGEY